MKKSKSVAATGKPNNRRTPREYILKIGGEDVPVKSSGTLEKIQYAVKLPECGKEAKVTIEFGKGEVERKAKITFPGSTKIRNARDQKGRLVRFPISVPTTYVAITVNGRTFKARACCKPPDQFLHKVGIKLALRRLLAEPEFKKLVPGKDRRALVRVCQSKAPGKPKQDRTQSPTS